MFNSNAKEFVPTRAVRKHYHSRERYVRSLGRGEVDHRMGTHAREEGRSVGVGSDGCTR